MSFSFDVRHGLVIIQVEVSGPSGSAILSFALDTGATATLINLEKAVSHREHRVHRGKTNGCHTY